MDNILASLLRSTVFLCLFYGIYWVFLRKETFFTLNRIYLLAAGVLSLALPLIPLPSPFFRTVIAPRATDWTLLQGSGGTPAASPPSPLAILYLAGVAFFLVLFLFRLFRLLLAARRCDCRSHRGLRIVLCPGWNEPFSFFRTVFLDRSKKTEDEFESILAHEMIHVRQVHSLDILLGELVSVIQWFNPFVWPYKYSLRETHEYLADRAVVAQGRRRTWYQLLIVEQHVGGKLLEFASHFRTSQIKRRIAMLSRKESKGWSRFKLLLILPAAVALVLVFAEPRTVYQDAPQEAVVSKSQAESKAPEPSDEEVLAALKKKQMQLEIMKKEQATKIAELKKAYEETEDAAKREKIMAMLKEQKMASVEIGQKERVLQMKKLEMMLNAETDPAKKEVLKAKFEDLKLQTEENAKKMQALAAKAEEEKQKAAQKKAEEEKKKN